MKRGLAILVVLVAAAAGFGGWRLARDQVSPLPQISVYSHGHSERVGPYLYCNVVNLNDCITDGVQGTLAVSSRYPVQLSVPTAISSAPWRLLMVYDDERDTMTTAFRPGSRLAVTIPTVDARRGKLAGLVVQLLTLVQDQEGELHDVPHAEWSVRMVWN
ncbi:MAG: DUF2771 domain-containing protein [Mycobacterium sp.]|nr:DUF2771 domain-containing protein [Mycobacterium sp.]